MSATASSLSACELTWRYPRSENSAYELSAGGEIRGRLRFDERAGTQSTGELGGQRWTFSHSGGAHPRVTIAREGSPEVIAEFVPWLTGGGVVTFSGGPGYCWNRAGIWSTTWCFRRQGESRGSICVSQQAGPLRDGARVRICGEAAQVPETPVLVLLAWYLRILAFEILTETIPGVG
ncbi:MAG TPA: hypothetical protein VGS58_11580 [Candidatus Sulfopaludibacter sp.]|nr:hypothetical protein [Candidatus Sulfopaludibacter sp.]